MTNVVSIPINNGRRVFPGARLNALSRSPHKFRIAPKVLACRNPDDLPPFFKITDDDGTASSFVKALTDFRLDAARGFISKNFVSSIDVHELAATFEGAAACKMVCAEFSSCPRNCKVKSVLVMDGENAPCAVVHLRMIREPDCVSSWKIYSVEKEC